MFRLSAVTWGNRPLSTDRTQLPRAVVWQDTPIATLDSPPSVDRAIDCWCHGVAHLLSAIGPEAALTLMAKTVVDLVDRSPGSPAQLRPRGTP